MCSKSFEEEQMDCARLTCLCNEDPTHFEKVFIDPAIGIYSIYVYTIPFSSIYMYSKLNQRKHLIKVRNNKNHCSCTV